MKFTETRLSGLYIIESNVFRDTRGYFFEGFNRQSFTEKGVDIKVEQTNISQSQAGVVRGLHFQNPPYGQGKLIRVLKGAVLDVVVDIRKQSSTYGEHYAIELSEENCKALWVPPGFAHGFKTLADNTLFYYDCTEVYNKESEGSILWNDPTLDIDWDIDNPILSPKDENGQLFKNFASQF